MKENNNGNDTNVGSMKNSIEEDVKMVEDFIDVVSVFLPKYSTKKVEKIIDEESYIAIKHILSDYKRALKENEELKQEKINNYRMIALAQNEALGYMQGYEDGKKIKTSAIASIVENQQYYIIKKQMEKYEEHIAKLQKENEELKRLMAHKNGYTKLLEEDLFENCSNYVIPIQTIKGKIEELKQEKEKYGNCLIKMYEDELVNRDIKILQELLEGRK